MTNVRIATFNCENLFARFRFNERIDPNKAIVDGWMATDTAFDIADADAKRITAAAIKATKADVVCLQEVEGGDSLKRFRNEYLGGSSSYPYFALIDGNDPRWIDVAILSKLPILSVTSWQHLKSGRSFVFSRDCLEADIELPNGSVLTVYNNHFKSMMEGREQTRLRREAQVKAVREIIEGRFGKTVGRKAVVVAGDFNDYIDSATGISELVGWSQLENVVERLPEEERWTHFWSKQKEYRQLDYILVSTALASRMSGPPQIERRGSPKRAAKYAGKRFDGVGDNHPKASDHCPVTVEIEL